MGAKEGVFAISARDGDGKGHAEFDYFRFAALP
jgi:hypothetical protein